LNTDDLKATPAELFFRALMKRWPQGLWVVTPSGEVLGFHYHTPKAGASQRQNHANWVADTLQMLNDSLAKVGELPPRAVRAENPFPDRGVGYRADQSLRFALVAVPLFAKTGKQDGPPALDSAILTREDWNALHPPTAEEMTVPAAVAAKFAPAFSPFTDKILVPLPSHVSTARMTARVVRSDATGEVIRFRGNWAASWDRDGGTAWPVTSRGTGDGVGIWDRQTQSWVELLWVLRGEHRSGPTGRATITPFPAVVEWSRERASDN
jgi:hypothetical protein